MNLRLKQSQEILTGNIAPYSKPLIDAEANWLRRRSATALHPCLTDLVPCEIAQREYERHWQLMKVRRAFVLCPVEPRKRHFPK
jgi:hypothetical protein